MSFKVMLASAVYLVIFLSLCFDLLGQPYPQSLLFTILTGYCDLNMMFPKGSCIEVFIFSALGKWLSHGVLTSPLTGSSFNRLFGGDRGHRSRTYSKQLGPRGCAYREYLWPLTPLSVTAFGYYKVIGFVSLHASTTMCFSTIGPDTTEPPDYGLTPLKPRGPPPQKKTQSKAKQKSFFH